MQVDVSDWGFDPGRDRDAIVLTMCTEQACVELDAAIKASAHYGSAVLANGSVPAIVESIDNSENGLQEVLRLRDEAIAASKQTGPGISKDPMQGVSLGLSQESFSEVMDLESIGGLGPDSAATAGGGSRRQKSSVQAVMLQPMGSRQRMQAGPRGNLGAGSFADDVSSVSGGSMVSNGGSRRILSSVAAI